MKKLIVGTIALSAILLGGCGNQSVDAEQTKISERFVGGEKMRITTDTKTGCEYIRARGQSSWTYVHGSCPEVIAKESNK